MEYVLESPRFQVVWRRACRVFGFYASDTTRCSVSNIAAFQEMVQKEYTHLIGERSIGNNVQAVREIQDAAIARNNRILAQNDPEERLDMLHIGPVELLEMIGDDVNKHSRETVKLLSLLSRDMNA